jgi:hypothetical protein
VRQRVFAAKQGIGLCERAFYPARAQYLANPAKLINGGERPETTLAEKAAAKY